LSALNLEQQALRAANTVENMGEQSTIRTVVDVLSLRSQSDPERTAILVDDTRTLTFRDWELRSNAVGHALRGLGVQKGDRVGLLFARDAWIEYAVTYLGILKVGGTALHLSGSLPEREIARRSDECRVALVVHSQRVAVPAGTRAAAFEELVLNETSAHAVELGGEDVAGITYTSGTTAGRPRALVLPHRDHVPNFDPKRALDYEKAAKFFLGVFPIGTSSAQNIVISAVTHAAKVVVLTSCEPELVCAMIAKHGVDSIMLTPTVAIDILNSGAATRHDLGCVRDTTMGAAPITSTTLERVARMLPNAKIYQFYGLSEAVPGIATMQFDPNRPGSVGKPTGETQIEIRDSAGRSLPFGELGEIYVRHPKRIRYYLSDSPQSPRDIFIRSGDLGSMDADGYLYFFDRAADAIHCRSRLCSSVQIENVLQQYPGVLDVCVVATPHPELDQAVGAAVVLAPGASLEGLKEFARGRLDEQAMPRSFLTAEKLPRGVIGKPLKREIRTWFDPARGELARRAHGQREVAYW
jgi:fatty-acyl-CoA synthase